MLAEQCDRCASDGHSNGSLLGHPPQAHDPQQATPCRVQFSGPDIASGHDHGIAALPHNQHDLLVYKALVHWRHWSC